MKYVWGGLVVTLVLVGVGAAGIALNSRGHLDWLKGSARASS